MGIKLCVQFVGVDNVSFIWLTSDREIGSIKSMIEGESMSMKENGVQGLNKSDRIDF